jgi:hypothetical protein
MVALFEPSTHAPYRHRSRIPIHCKCLPNWFIKRDSEFVSLVDVNPGYPCLESPSFFAEARNCCRHQGTATNVCSLLRCNMNNRFSFIGGKQGEWRVQSMKGISGVLGLESVERLEIVNEAVVASCNN